MILDLLQKRPLHILKKKPIDSSRLFVILVLVWVMPCTEATHHWIPHQHEMGHNVRVGMPHIFRRQEFSQKMRFEVFYDESMKDLSPSKSSLVKNKLIPEAVAYFQNTLSVRPSKLNITLQRTCRKNAYYLKDTSGDKKGDVQFCKLECVQTKCGPVTVPKQHLDQCRICDTTGVKCLTMPGSEWRAGQGVKDKDFILYVSSIQTTHCYSANAVAYASYCQQEQVLDRPVAGFVNLCPERLETDTVHYSNLKSTVKHEIYHALGFSAGLYAFYRKRDGSPYTARMANGLPPYNKNYNLYQWSPSVVKKIVRKKWAVRHGYVTHTVHMIVTPRVKENARKHFNCKSLEGAEIENQGGLGTELTHWEKRLFENEAMTGTYTQNPVFSRLTLALMEDTGWYKANYSMADTLDWGKNLGCTFAKSSCKTWMEQHMEDLRLAQPFCFTIKRAPLRMRCTHSRMSVALCNLRQYDEALPNEYQYFSFLPDTKGKDLGMLVRDTAYYGGAVALADYCPYYQKFTLSDKGGKKRETTCTVKDNAPAFMDNYALESYGKQSRCFEQGRQWTGKKGLLTRTMLDWGSGCYRYYCDDGIKIQIGDKVYSCLKAGQHIEVHGYLGEWAINGSLICPSCRQFCGDTTGCPMEIFDNKTDEDGIEKDRKSLATNTRPDPDYWKTFVLRWMLSILVTVYVH